jgi:hypothetical protein
MRATTEYLAKGAYLADSAVPAKSVLIIVAGSAEARIPPLSPAAARAKRGGRIRVFTRG